MRRPRPRGRHGERPGHCLDDIRKAGVIKSGHGIMDTIRGEMGFARKLADKVHVLADGRILEPGAPAQVFDNPENTRLTGFIRSI